MKFLSKALLILLLSPIFPVAADNSLVTESPNPLTDNTGSNELAKYLLNLGAYLGFDLKSNPAEAQPPIPILHTLLNLAGTQVIESYWVTSFLGALPINSLLPQFLPPAIPGASVLNDAANRTFTSPTPYSSPVANKISINPLIDQKVYQKDPVNQSILNILGTADPTFCSIDYKKTELEACGFMEPNKLLTNIIGRLPAPTAAITDAFYGPTYIQGLLGQLNSNSLLGPLNYSSTTGDETSPTNVGLAGQSQAVQASNFIRYASGTLIPLKGVTFDEYNSVYKTADFDDKSTQTDTASVTAKYLARQALNTYFTDLRSHAAQVSVGMGNLYSILSKRMEQNMGGTGTSQAQSEYNMATRRLSIDSNPEVKSWVEQINSASSATVQKEMAILLAEINYQMYLNRQQDERLLMTESIILLQNIRPPMNTLRAMASNR
ncbi:MAG: type IV secretion protein IcmX [Legionella sp.]|nr:type IV secretion protein IcmX [Legionella sp.]